jgi:phosphatidylinositol glycan class H protein
VSVQLPHFFYRVSAESVLVIPPHGIQLETHRGLPSIPLTASRRFIPTVALQDFIINEGLRGWDVRYYLVAIKRFNHDNYTLEIAYEVGALSLDNVERIRLGEQNILPHFPVLVEVYRGVQETLLFDATKNEQTCN